MSTQITQATPFVPTEDLAKRILEVVDAGLSKGVGSPIPGQMCVEAAVCYAMGLPHSDKPTCVGHAVNEFKIALNDSPQWESPESRARGLRALAIAQLGSSQINQEEFSGRVAKKTIELLLPEVLLVAAGVAVQESDKVALVQVAENCKKNFSRESAFVAANAADAAANAARAANAAYAARAAANAAYAATNATYAATNAASYAAHAAVNAATAAYAAANAANAARAAADAARATRAAHAATNSAYAARVANAGKSPEYFLLLSADIALEVLKELKSPGCEFLYLLDEPVA